MEETSVEWPLTSSHTNIVLVPGVRALLIVHTLRYTLSSELVLLAEKTTLSSELVLLAEKTTLSSEWLEKTPH